MHKALKCIAAVVLVLLVIGLAAMFAAGFVYDSYSAKALGRIQQKVPGLYLKNEVLSSGFFGREGLLSFSYAHGSSLKQQAVKGAVRYTINFSLSGVSAVWKLERSLGNLEDFVANVAGFNLPAIRGQVGWSLLRFGAYGEISAEDSSQSLGEDGTCRIGKSSLAFFSRNLTNLAVDFSLPALSCRGNKLYFEQPSFSLDAKDLKANLSASVDANGINMILREGSFSVKSLTGEISSVYAVGFEPDDQVRDPSLRDGLKLEDLTLAFKTGDPDNLGFADFEGSALGNLNFAFPRVKQGNKLPFYEIADLNMNMSLHKINFKDIIAYIIENQGDLSGLFNCFSKKSSIELRNLSFSHNGDRVTALGAASFELNPEKMKPERIAADFSATAGAGFVNELTGNQYREALSQLLESGAVSFDRRDYSTRLKLKHGKITLNGKAFSSDD